MDESVLGAVPGGADLLAWFGGRVPSFHDAEILGLELDRAGATCRFRVHAFEITGDVDQAGYFVLARHAVIAFELGGVTDLELADFNHQNVLGGLRIERQANGYHVELEPCSGLSGFLKNRPDRGQSRRTAQSHAVERAAVMARPVSVKPVG